MPLVRNFVLSSDQSAPCAKVRDLSPPMLYPVFRLPRITLLVAFFALVLGGAATILQAATSVDFLTATLPKIGAEPNDLPYRYLVPAGYNAANDYPLIVFLHGSGERGTNNTAQLNNSANGALTLVSGSNQAAYPCFMLAPQASVAEGWNGNTLAQVIRTIQELSLTYSIDPNRIYVTGLSMGGAGTWDIIQRYPTFFAAAVPMSGWGAGSYEKIVGLPIWNFHAANDGTVAVSGSDNAVAATRQIGGRVIYTRYATGGHGIWPIAYANPHLLPWMMTQRRNQPMAGVPLISIATPGQHLALPPATATRNVAGTASLPGGVTKINWTFTPWLGGAGVDTSAYALASGTDNWSVPNAPVASDSKLFLAIATGSSWATGTGSATGGGVTTLNDYFWNVPTGANVTAPAIAITSPTGSGSLTTAAFSLALAGTAAPASGKTVQAVTWRNNRGGEGACLGTTSWNIDNIDLQSGDNLLTVTVRDSHSITASKTIAVFVSTGSATTYRHGDTVTLTGSFGAQNVIKTFLGGANGMIESQAVDTAIPNSNNWTFDSLGYTAKIKSDSSRGKVLYNQEDDTHYNATRRFDSGAPIPEQRYIYKAHYVRNVVLLDGLPYTKSYQWKHERINWENSVVDGDCEIKMHDWHTQSPITYINRSATDKSTYYGGFSADHNGDWALMETIIFTGTQGQTNGKMITRVHKNGHTYISQNLQAERIYADPTLRLRYFVEQNYFGNFGQVEDGVDNTMPKPQVKEIYSDDSQVIVGRDATSGAKRVELRDSIALNTATIREVQDWTTWNGNITLRLNTGGLAVGTHDLYLVVIDGIDVNGWDIVSAAQPIRVQVDSSSVNSSVPTITTQPLSLPAFVGASVNFTAGANSPTALTYQWQKDGINLSGATTPSLSLSNVQLANAGNYALVATNTAGSATSNFARLVVLVAQANAITYATTVSATGVTAGGKVNLAYFVTNVGTRTWGANHFLSIRDSNGTFVAFAPLIGILPGEVTTATLNFPAPATPGTYTNYVQALENGVEFFSTQTTVTLTVLAPLTNSITYNTTTFPVSAAPGSNVVFTYSVTNTGTQSWGANHLLSFKNSTGTTLSSTPLTVLAPRASKTVNLSFTAPATPGIYSYTVQAFQTGVGDFNTRADLTLVVLAPRPNAIVYTRTRTPDEVVPGALLNLNYSLSNAGTQAWNSGHYVSLRDENGTFLSFLPLNGIATGGTTKVAFSFAAPTAPGLHTYFVQALENGIEFFSTQDVVVIQVDALPLRNAITYNATTFPATVAPGAAVSFTYNVTNRGTKTWGATDYLSFRDVDNTFLGFPSISGVAPGASKTVNISFTAPATPGIYTYKAQGLEDGVAFYVIDDTLVLFVQ